MRLHTHEAGQGTPVVLLHGLFGAARNLATVQAALATRYRVIAMDLRNHGASPHDWGMGYPVLAADVIETLDALGVDAAALIGHSMGGKVAMRVALDWPARVTRLVVGDIAPVSYGGVFTQYAAAMQALPLAATLTRAQADTALAVFVKDAAIRAFLLQNLNTGAAFGWRNGLAEITAGLPDLLGWPSSGQYDGAALFVRGERSDYVTDAHRPAIMAAFPHARIVTVPAAGHWLHADNPAAFLRIVSAFLAEGPDPAAGITPVR